jgi:hypothetical protein
MFDVKRFICVAVCLLAAGCSASSAGSRTNGETSEATSGAGGDGNPNLSGAGGGGGSLPADACPNVDILFVIDDSGSMADNQDSLIQSFPGFVQGIQERLAHAPSYHVGVVTSDDYYANPPPCQGIGSLITQTAGPESSNQVCGPFSSGAPFLDASEPNMAAKFACMAKVGSGGSSDERMARGLLNAVAPANQAPGACNAGFSRLDSLLVAVLITDEDDVKDGCNGDICDSYGSGGEPEDWYAELVAAKGGIPENIVMLSILGRKLDNPCGAVPASKLMGLTNDFGDNGMLGDVCAASYDEFFVDALPVIDKACGEYVPPPK